jgi:hypothetical protein
LKNELEMEPNWSKDKIVEMSDLTGLSQSQVYKWWWDQKKKNVRAEKDSFAKLIMAKKKHIRKDTARRTDLPYRADKEDGLRYEIEESAVATRVKANVELEQLPETERKINKRLVFA